MQAVAITSINAPTKRLEDYLDLGYEIVVAGDSLSDQSAWTGVSQGVHFLSLADQRELAPVLSDLTGSRTYARKNFAYLWAIANGASLIWETDDDTFASEQVGDPVEYTADGAHWTTSGEYWNPYGFFAPGSGLWPRGYPLTRVASDRAASSPLERSIPEPIGILQMLVTGEPDVDAIYRLTVSAAPYDFPATTDVVHLAPGTFAPGNTQATIWWPNSYRWIYVPRWVAFRFCDILKMYVAQSRVPMAYAGFLVEQVRNPHDLMKDFESEIEVYRHAERLRAMLLASDASSLSGVYESLVAAEICDPRELELAAAFDEAVSVHAHR